MPIVDDYPIAAELRRIRAERRVCPPVVDPKLGRCTGGSERA
jgi:hypothetical protein